MTLLSHIEKHKKIASLKAWKKIYIYKTQSVFYREILISLLDSIQKGKRFSFWTKSRRNWI